MSDNTLLELALEDSKFKKELVNKTRKIINSAEFSKKQFKEISDALKNAIVKAIEDAVDEGEFYVDIERFIDKKLLSVFKDNLVIEIKPSSSKE